MVEWSLHPLRIPMKAPEFRHSRGAAPRQGLALCLLLALLHLPSLAIAQVELVFVCPCTVEHAAGTGTVTLKTSIKNLGNTTSGRLVLHINATIVADAKGIQTTHALDPLAPGAAMDTPIEVDIYLLERLLESGKAISFSLSLSDVKSEEPYRPRSWDSVKFPAVVPVMNSLGTVTSIDLPEARYLDDADGDGVSDYNENLMKTDPTDPYSKPDAPVLYIMALYTEAYAQSDSEPQATVIHHVEWTNMALKNSGVGFRYRLAKVRQTDHEIHPDGPLISLAQGRRTFSGVRAEAETAGADFVTLYTAPQEHLKWVCGLAASDGRSLLSDDEGWGGAFSMVSLGCRAYTLAHELGHNLGLAHDVREDSQRTGIFRWSRGHGVDHEFVTVMAYIRRYSAPSCSLWDDNIKCKMQLFSNPKVEKCGSSKSAPCGVERDKPFAANAALTLNTVMYKASQWAPDPPDDDGDGIINFLEALDSDGDGTLNVIDAFPDDATETADMDGDKIGDNKDTDDDNDGTPDVNDAFPLDPTETKDTDGDGVGDNADAFINDPQETSDTDGDGTGDKADTDDDGDGLTDTQEAILRTSPFKSDTDGDGVNDGIDAFPKDDRSSNFDADDDGVDAALDADDNDARVTWTRYRVTLAPDAIPRANLIATFDWTTEKPAEIRANTTKYEVTGVFANPAQNHWNLYSFARVGAASVSTTHLTYPAELGSQRRGTIKVKNVVIAGEYINFLATGGGDETDIGVSLFAAGTSTLLTDWKPSDCQGWIKDDSDWRHFDVSALTGRSVDIEIYDNEGDHRLGEIECNSISFDHFYQSDSTRGELVGTAIALPDTDGDGLSDVREAALGTNPNLPDTDGDNVNDGIDAFPLDATETTDTDGDRIGNNADPDDDNDGLTDIEEAALGTNPLVADSDGDNVNDGMDAFPLDDTETTDTDGDRIGNNADLDDDNDGLTDIEEAALGTNPLLADTDGDTVNDKMDVFPLDDSETTDTDGDQIGNNTDLDDDNDGLTDIEEAALGTNPLLADTDGDTVNDKMDAFPLDDSETLDTDGDRIGNNADLDDDGDGVLDTADAFPLDDTETTDTDGDRIGNNADLDDDGDGILDTADAFPLDDTETTDTDGDRIGNNADPDDDNDGLTDIEEAALGTNPLLADTDGDNVNDGADAFPLDDTETTDSDGDNVGDNADAFPNDSSETADSDNDGTGDNADAFPNDRTETLDTDGDRIGDNTDPDDDNDGLTDIEEAALGTNPLLADTDGDTVNDSMDAFPLDDTETTDTDGDRIGNNADLDDDNDGTPDTADAFPLDAIETLDTDGDRIGNNADPDDDNDGVGDARDVEPHNVAVAYEPDKGQVLLPDGMDARNVIGDFDDLAEIRAKAKYELTGVFANPDLTNWNRFEEEERVAAAAVNN